MERKDSGPEPVQELPAGPDRGFGSYFSDEPFEEDRSITNVGGYVALRDLIADSGSTLGRNVAGLRLVDGLIGSAPESTRGLAREIGMFYGDVLTHTITGSHWVVRDPARPEVRITDNVTVDVVGVGQRRTRFGTPTLVEDLAHVLLIAQHGA